jgi:general secretion pathway protein I
MIDRNRQRGFTLLEVMVALAVIAFAMAAAISAASGNTRNAAGLQNRTFAHWVAMNKMTELQINKEWPAMTTTRGSALMASHEWFWTMKVSSAPDKSVRRVDISVSAEEDDEYSLVTLTGFVVQP